MNSWNSIKWENHKEHHFYQIIRKFEISVYMVLFGSQFFLYIHSPFEINANLRYGNSNCNISPKFDKLTQHNGLKISSIKFKFTTITETDAVM